MSEVCAEEISIKLKRLLDELSALEVHSIILASFTNQDRVVFGMEMNTSAKVAKSLLEAGCKRVEDMRIDDVPPRRVGLQ